MPMLTMNIHKFYRNAILSLTVDVM